MLQIRYFAWLKQRTGLAEERLDLPAEIATVGALKAWLGVRHPRFAEACAAEGVVRAAVDLEHAEDDQVTIAGAREVAFFPPVTGG